MIFNAFKLVPFEELKVVIVNNEPYYMHNQAMGLCFSVTKSAKRVPPVLKNIYKMINFDKKITNFVIPKHGDLTKWA